MASRETIRDFYGSIVGYLDDEGREIVARSFSGRILGRYIKSDNTTRDFEGRILYKGNMAAALLVLKQ